MALGLRQRAEAYLISLNYEIGQWIVRYLPMEYTRIPVNSTKSYREMVYVRVEARRRDCFRRFIMIALYDKGPITI